MIIVVYEEKKALPEAFVHSKSLRQSFLFTPYFSIYLCRINGFRAIALVVVSRLLPGLFSGNSDTWKQHGEYGLPD